MKKKQQSTPPAAKLVLKPLLTREEELEIKNRIKQLVLNMQTNMDTLDSAARLKIRDQIGAELVKLQPSLASRMADFGQHDAAEVTGPLLEALFGTITEQSTLTPLNDKTLQPSTTKVKASYLISVPIKNNLKKISDLLNDMEEAEVMGGVNFSKTDGSGDVKACGNKKLTYKFPKDKEIFLSPKRFNYQGNKTSTPIQIDNFTRGRTDYEPRAILCHRGTTSRGGHYVTFVKERDRQWYLYDDSTKSGPLDWPLKYRQDSVNELCYVIKYAPVGAELPKHQNTGTANNGNKCWFNSALAMVLSSTTIPALEQGSATASLVTTPSGPTIPFDLLKTKEEYIDDQIALLQAISNSLLETEYNIAVATLNSYVSESLHELITTYKLTWDEGAGNEGEENAKVIEISTQFQSIITGFKDKCRQKCSDLEVPPQAKVSPDLADVSQLADQVDVPGYLRFEEKNTPNTPSTSPSGASANLFGEVVSNKYEGGEVSLTTLEITKNIPEDEDEKASFALKESVRMAKGVIQKAFEEYNKNCATYEQFDEEDLKKLTEDEVNDFVFIMKNALLDKRNDLFKQDNDDKKGFSSWTKELSDALKGLSGNGTRKYRDEDIKLKIEQFKEFSAEIQIQATNLGLDSPRLLNRIDKDGKLGEDKTKKYGARSFEIIQLLPDNYEFKGGNQQSGSVVFL